MSKRDTLFSTARETLSNMLGGANAVSDDNYTSADSENEERTILERYGTTVQRSQLHPVLDKFSIFRKRQGLVVAEPQSADEDDRDELQRQLDNIYDDIEALIQGSQAEDFSQWSVEDLEMVRDLIDATDTQLKDMKREQKAEKLADFKKDAKLYEKYYYFLISEIGRYTKLIEKKKRNAEEREKEVDRLRLIEDMRGAPPAAAGEEPRLAIPGEIIEEMRDLRRQLWDLRLEKEVASSITPEPRFLRPTHRREEERERSKPQIKAMTCPNFKGEYESYISFKKTFSNLYERESLSKVDLAMRLYSHLEGTAKAEVDNLYKYHLDKLCYDKMWAELEKHYGGEEVHSSEIVTKAVTMRDFTRLEPSEIKEFYDTLKKQVEYWEVHDPRSLRKKDDFKYVLIKLKLSPRLQVTYQDYRSERHLADNMYSLWLWTNELFCKFLRSQKETKSRNIIQRIHKDLHRSEGRARKPQEQPRKREKTPEVKTARGYEPSSEESDSESDGELETLFLDGDSDEEVTVTKAQMRKYVARKSTSDGCKDCRTLKHKPVDCQAFKKLQVIQRAIFIRNTKICFHCLDGIHRAGDCKYKEGIKCGIDGCDRYHHELLHSVKTSTAIMHAQFPEAEAEEELLLGSSYSTEKGRSNMQTLVTKIEGTKGTKKIVCMLDTGANVSCIDEELAKELGATHLTKLGKQYIKYLDRKVPVNSQMVRVTITNLEGNDRYTMDAWTIPNLSKGTRAVDWSEEKKKWKHLEHIEFPALPEDQRINFLIGHIYSDFFIPNEFAKGTEPMQPLGVKTPYGWTVLGGTKRKHNLMKNMKSYIENDQGCFKAIFSRAIKTLSRN